MDYNETVIWLYSRMLYHDEPIGWIDEHGTQWIMWWDQDIYVSTIDESPFFVRDEPEYPPKV